MFSRYLPFLEKKFKKIKILCREHFYELLKRSFKYYKKLEFIKMKKAFPRYDKSVILSHLPYYLNMPLDNIPSDGGYLIANNSKIDKYSKIIKSDKLKVGICWEAGGTGWRELLNRTIHISLYEPFFDIKDTKFYSLQVNPTLNDYKEYKNLIELGSSFENYDDTAGAIMNLDLVITVDTSIAHIAGALGKKTFMLLPYVTDWRWFDNDKTTEWYDSVKIFKQKNPQSWDDVIENIKKEIENG